MLSHYDRIKSLEQVPSYDGYVVDADLVLNASEPEVVWRRLKQELGHVAYLVVGHTKEEVAGNLGHQPRFYANPDELERSVRTAALYLGERFSRIAYVSANAEEETARRNDMPFVPLSTQALR